MDIFSRSKTGGIPDISIVIVNESLPNSNVETFLTSSSRLSLAFEMIIVTCKIARKTDILHYIANFLENNHSMSKMTIVLLDFDKGPAYRRNIGASLSISPYLLFADDDSAVLDDVSPLLRFLREDLCQGVQPLILKLTDTSIVDSAGDFLKKQGRFLYIPYSRGAGRRVNELRSELRIEELSSMRSAFMIVQKKAFIDIGGFDDTFDFNFEDVDLGWRMVSAGYRLLFVPTVKALHKGGKTTDPRFFNDKAVNLGLVNSYVTQLKIVSFFLWFYIFLSFQISLVSSALSRSKREPVVFVFLVRQFALINRLFIGRVKQAFLHKQMLSRNFGYKGRKRLEEMATGSRFYFSQSTQFANVNT